MRGIHHGGVGNGPDIRPVTQADSHELAILLNEIIARGGTTALEEPFEPGDLANTLLIGRDVICCFVAADRATGKLSSSSIRICRHSFVNCVEYRDGELALYRRELMQQLINALAAF